MSCHRDFFLAVSCTPTCFPKSKTLKRHSRRGPFLLWFLTCGSEAFAAGPRHTGGWGGGMTGNPHLPAAPPSSASSGNGAGDHVLPAGAPVDVHSGQGCGR